MKFCLSPYSWGRIVIFSKPLGDGNIVASVEVGWVISKTSKAYILSFMSQCYPVLIRDSIRIEAFESSKAFDGFHLPSKPHATMYKNLLKREM